MLLTISYPNEQCDYFKNYARSVFYLLFHPRLTISGKGEFGEDCHSYSSQLIKLFIFRRGQNLSLINVTLADEIANCLYLQHDILHLRATDSDRLLFCGLLVTLFFNYPDAQDHQVDVQDH